MTHMKFNTSITVTISIVLFGLMLPNAQCMAASNINLNQRHSIPTYSASYKVYWHGIKVGTSVHTVKQLNQNGYRAQIVTKPITKLMPFGYTESSEFSVINSNIVPHRYQFNNEEHGLVKQGILYFDWKRKQITNIITDQDLYALNTNMQDKLSHIFQLQTDIRKQLSLLNYTVVKDHDVSLYKFKVLGEEIIQTPIGKLATIKLEHKTAGSNRITILWLAKALNLTIAQSKQYRNNSLSAHLIIDGYST